MYQAAIDQPGVAIAQFAFIEDDLATSRLVALPVFDSTARRASRQPILAREQPPCCRPQPGARPALPPRRANRPPAMASWPGSAPGTAPPRGGPARRSGSRPMRPGRDLEQDRAAGGPPARYLARAGREPSSPSGSIRRSSRSARCRQSRRRWADVRSPRSTWKRRSSPRPRDVAGPEITRACWCS
jgi:hypothetical protein